LTFMVTFFYDLTINLFGYILDDLSRLLDKGIDFNFLGRLKKINQPGRK
jgi:hypothetical protein